MINYVLATGNSKSGSLFKLKPLGKIYWTRFLVAIVAAITCAGFGQTGLSGIALGVSFYIISYILVRYVLNIEPEEVGGTRTLYSKGIGTYLFTWITLWTIIHTFALG